MTLMVIILIIMILNILGRSKRWNWGKQNDFDGSIEYSLFLLFLLTIISFEVYIYLEICLFFNHFLILNTLIFLLKIYFYAFLYILIIITLCIKFWLSTVSIKMECFSSKILELKFGMIEEEIFFLKLLLNKRQVQSRKSCHKFW